MKSLWFFLFITISIFSYAEKWDSTYVRNLISKGEVNKVFQFYQSNYLKNHNSVDAIKIAELMYSINEYVAAKIWYEKEIEQVIKINETLFKYATACRLSGDYQKASNSYQLYLKQNGEINDAVHLKNVCDRLFNASDMTASFKLENYTFNTDMDEENISFLRTNPIYINKVKKNNMIFYNAHQVVRLFEKFAPPVKVYKDELTNFNITGLSYTSDGNTVVFSAKNKDRVETDKNEQLFIGENLGGKFLNIKPFPYNISSMSLKNPSLNSDGTVLYFSSDLPDGFGGFDIWKSTFVKEDWTKPVNLGELINSKSDEINPFIVQDETVNELYFSSNREDGFGGFDIYMANTTNSGLQNIKLQPAPINSIADDISIIYDNTIKTGYFSSNRKNGKGGFDVYRFTPFNLKMIIQVLDSESRQPIKYAVADLRDNTNLESESISNDDGRIIFLIEKDKSFNIHISKEKYIPYISEINPTNKSNGDSIEIIAILKKENINSIPKSLSSLTSDDFIYFKGQVIDSITKLASQSIKMKMINYTTNKLRELEIDSQGKFEIKLFTNNNYKIIFNNSGTNITDEITTIGIEKGSVKICNYIISNTSFVLSGIKK